MEERKLGVVEARFADMIWENAPVSSAVLAAMALEKLQWKKSTTYTVLKRLCDKGLFQNEQGTVEVLVSKEEYYALQSEKFVEDTFAGSLPAFLTAFGSRKKLSDAQIDELQRIIDGMRR